MSRPPKHALTSAVKQQTLRSSPLPANGRCAVGRHSRHSKKRGIPMQSSATKFAALALLGASLTACGASAPDEADTAESAQTITGSTCAQFGTINQGDYIVQADEWNSTQQQC